MAVPSSLKTLNSIHHFSIKTPSPSPPSSSLSSMKLKTLLQTFIFSHMYRIARALSKAKSLLIQLLKTSKNKQQNLFFGSFRLHYNWCSSSRTVPVMLQASQDYSGCTSVVSSSLRHDGMPDSGELSKYLQWLEEKCDQDWDNEIDRLADLFIANCHEKFRLEKQESYRRYQEMMARSVWYILTFYYYYYFFFFWICVILTGLIGGFSFFLFSFIPLFGEYIIVYLFFLYCVFGIWGEGGGGICENSNLNQVR